MPEQTTNAESVTLTRRTWLAAVAAGAMVSPLPADEKSPSMTLGFSLYGMKTVPVLEAIKTCSEIGYRDVELALLKGWPCDPSELSPDVRREIRQRLQDTNTKLPALMDNLPLVGAVDVEGHLDRIRAAAEVGHALSPESPPVLETVLGGKPAAWDESRSQLVERLGDWSRVAEKHKLVIAVKPHVGGALHTPQDAAWLMRQVGGPHLKLCYDFSHYYLRKFDLVESIKLLAADSVFVHVKDAKGDAAKVEFLLPGTAGTIDYVLLFQTLKDAGYTGSVTVEVSAMLSSRPGYDPIAAAKTSYEPLTKALAAAS